MELFVNSSASYQKRGLAMEKLCGLYARISDPKDSYVKDNSVDTQIDKLKGYVDYESKNKPETTWKVVDTYRDEGKSGKNTDRPALQKLLSDIKAGRINTIICTRLDRITRSLLDFYKLYEIFTKYNVHFISLLEKFDTTSEMGRAMLKMTLVWAELERGLASERTKAKMVWRASQGLWNGGHVLGYDLVDKKLVINKHESKLVNLTFSKYLEFGSILKVVEYLNDHGYRTKEYISRRNNIKRGGSLFYYQYVSHILSNKLYLGQIEQQGKVYPGKHKPVIDNKLWHEVNAKIKLQTPKRTSSKRQTKHVFLLQGLLKCGWCGDYMSSKYSTGRKGLCYYYQCTQNARRGKNVCSMKYVPASQIEKVVITKLKEMSIDKKRIQRIVEEANKDTSSTLKSLKKDRKNQEVKVVGVKDKIKNILYNISIHPRLKNIKSIAEELAELEQQKEQVNKDIQSIDFEVSQVQQQVLSARIMYESLTKFSQICDVAAPQELKDLLPTFVERITWTPTEIEIALFEHEVQKEQLPPTSNHSSGGALKLCPS
jgi:site-specific DNA recombinase